MIFRNGYLRTAMLVAAVSCLAMSASALQTVAADGSGDHLTINDALAAAAAGEEVRIIDGGTYDETLAPTQDIFLTASPNPATLSVSGTDANVFNAASAISGTVENITFDGQGNSANTLLLQSQDATSTWNFTNCAFINSATRGFWSRLNAGASFTFTDCLFQDHAANAILTTNSGSDLTLIRTDFINSGARGIFFNGGTDWNFTMQDCTMNGTVNEGIRVAPAGVTFTTFDISGSTLTNVDNIGINMTGGAGVFSVTDSTISNCNGQGVRFVAASADSVTFTGNTFSGNTDVALNLNDTNEVVKVVESNVFVDGSGQSGAVVQINSAAAGSTFINNLIDQGLIGLSLTSSDVDVYHNTIVNDDNSTVTAGILLNDDVFTTRPVDIQNNVVAFCDVGTSAVVGIRTDGLTFDYNLSASNTTDWATEVLAVAGGNVSVFAGDPGFRSASPTAGAGDYQIDSSVETILVNAGNPGLGVAADLIGNPRPQPAATDPDLGAYEDTVLVPVELSEFNAQ